MVEQAAEDVAPFDIVDVLLKVLAAQGDFEAVAQRRPRPANFLGELVLLGIAHEDEDVAVVEDELDAFFSGRRGAFGEFGQQLLQGKQDEVVLVAESVLQRHQRHTGSIGKQAHLQSVAA